MTIDGRPYGPVRFEQIVEERYQISKHTHTSYKDLDNVTPLERKYLLSFIERDLTRENELRQQQAAKLGVK